MKRHWLDVAKRKTYHHTRRELPVDPARTRRAKRHALYPLNQFLDLSVEEKDLPVQGLPADLDGLKVAHLSDIHLTGQIDPAFHALAAKYAADWHPDVAFVTGDLVDFEPFTIELPTVFQSLQCPLGQYFVLGNHDLRVPNPTATRRTMESIGWIDLGGKSLLQTWRGLPVELLGNEMPWFEPYPQPATEPPALRIALCHTPDQIDWARRNQVHLMLAGHTHGGQGRLPVLGPVLSPSWYGSRYASGEFYLSPTTLHVTRGLSGVHLMRINCPPEVSLLTLRAVPTLRT